MDSIPGLANILANDSLDFGSKDSDGLGGRKAESGGAAGEGAISMASNISCAPTPCFGIGTSLAVGGRKRCKK